MTANKRIFSYRVLFKTMTVGFFGGNILLLFSYLLYYFNMLEFNMFSLVKNLVTVEKMTWIGIGLMFIMISLLSISISLLYYISLKTFQSWFISCLFGVIVWAVLYIAVPFIFKNFNSFIHFTWSTHIHSLCLFILYGVFIGYSISFEFESVQYDRMRK